MDKLADTENEGAESIPEPKLISEEEIQEILARQDGRKVTPFEATKLEKEAKKNWDLFYKRNETRFFKDRHWTLQEFEEVSNTSNPVLLEVGCGCGNFIFPMLEEVPGLKVLACDFSPRAVEFVKSHENYDETRIRAFVCDITAKDCFSPLEELAFCKEKVKEKTEENGVDVHYNAADFLSMIFVLSSISPGQKHRDAIENISKAVKPGGVVFFRDYGRHDMAQLRFKGGKKIDENFYARRDGTRAYYFTPEEVISLFENVGLAPLSCDFVHRRTVNVKEGINVERTFVQGKFIKKSV
ncbi:Methyltransferase-like protein 6 [Orchesella cincta]|uniref:tRNA N(3)-methylcytidine methyltransferase n=1 Tax=Orchesella cincta TaxID=48709 RepID=A0A1D2N6W8_ORCCI|nr:Methyltransferase-like protein 6 [Orchesella cincta]